MQNVMIGAFAHIRSEAEDVAGGILFLLSDASSYITGLILDMNGGLGMTD